MADQLDSRPPLPTAADVAAWQKEEKEAREAKRKKKPTEFSRPPLAKKEFGPGRARLEGSAFQPGRSNLPPNVFGYKPEVRNPEDIIIAREAREERKVNI